MSLIMDILNYKFCNFKQSKFEKQRFIPSGCKNIRVSKFELVSKTQLLCSILHRTFEYYISNKISV